MSLYNTVVRQYVLHTHYSMIMARDEKGAIGYENGLPWPKCKSDMAWFRKHTMGKVIVMGRKTFESIGSKPLPGRINIVVSSSLKDTVGKEWNKANPNPEAGYLLIAPNVEAVKKLIKDTTGTLHNGGEVMIIGGAHLYQAFWNEISGLYLTTFKDQGYKSDIRINIDLSAFNKVFMDKTSFLEPTFEIYDAKQTLWVDRDPEAKEAPLP